MGWFDNKIKIVVSSTMLNMAGDPDNRFNYLKSSVLSSVLSKSNNLISEDVLSAQWNGPAFQYKSFYRWAKTNFPIGHIKTNSRISKEIKEADIKAYLGLPTGTSAFIHSIDVSGFSIYYFALDYMAKNQPSNINTNWTYGQSDDGTQIEIILQSGTKILFTPSSYDTTGTYIYVNYEEVTDIIRENVVTEPEVISPNRPDLEDYKLVSQTIISSIPTILTGSETTTITYSNSTPTSTSTVPLPSKFIDLNIRREVWSKTEFIGDTENKTINVDILRREVVGTQTSIIITSVVSGGVIITTTKTRVEEVVDPEWTYKFSSQTFYSVALTNPKVFIYKVGSGNTVLDNLVTQTEKDDKFFPVIPVKFINRYIDEGGWIAPLYEPSKKAFKRVFKTNIDDLIEDLKDTPNQNKMNFVYNVFGVSLNIKDNSSRKYIIEFLKYLESISINTFTDYKKWSKALDKAKAIDQKYEDWLAAQRDINHPLYGTNPPPKGTRVSAPSNAIQLRNKNAGIFYSVIYSFRYIQTTKHIGIGKTGAKIGEVWSDVALNDFTYKFDQKPEVIVSKAQEDVVTFYHQVTSTYYEKIKVVGLMQFVNMKDTLDSMVTVPARMALADPEESGFLVPLNYDIMSKLSLKDSTQLSTASSNLLINSYAEYKIPWYTKILPYVLMVGSIVFSIFTAGAGLALAGGILGTNLAVGTAIGLSGTAAAIVGAVANTLAGVVISMVITEASTAIFGDQIGAIIGIAVSLLTLSIGSMYAMTGTINLDISQLFTAENLLKITDSVSNSYQEFVKGNIESLNQELTNISNSYDVQMKEIDKLTKELLAGTGLLIGLDTLLGNDLYIPESREAFIQRTLLTGTDIAQMTNNMITQFPSLTINTELKV